MPSSCCIKNCDDKRENRKGKSIFKIPKNPDKEKMWMDAILDRLRDGPNRKKLLVCEKHFFPDDIEREFKTILPDGTVHKIPRKVPLLKSTAVPRIFGDDERKLVEKCVENQCAAEVKEELEEDSKTTS